MNLFYTNDNKDKCHLLVSNNELEVDGIEVESSDCEKLLGIKIDSKLNFQDHLDGVNKKASQKVNALSRITPYLNNAKRRLLMNSFFYITV